MSKLLEYHQKYEKIMSNTTNNLSKDKQLSRLMNQLEKEFQIPAIRDQAWEATNKEIIALYRKIANSRTTL